jgi:ribonuclease PH
VLIETGGTRVLCNVSIEEKGPACRQESGRGRLTAEYAMLPRATHTRTPRSAGAGGARSQEEGIPFDRPTLDQLLGLAVCGIEQILQYQREALTESGVFW